MSSTAAASPSDQGIRLAILLAYLGGLFVASELALGSWVPPTTEKGLWFYAALAALLLGNLLVSPFFTKPADALSYGVVSLVTLLAVDAWSAIELTDFDQVLWTLATAYVAVVVVSSIGSIFSKNSGSATGLRVSKSLYVLAEAAGRPTVIFSVVFLFALIAYHRDSAREYLIIGASWGLFVVLQPLETLSDIVSRLHGIWRKHEHGGRLGEVVGHEVPRIVLIRESEKTGAAFGSIILVRSDDGEPGFAVALDHVGFAGGRWLRAVQLLNVDRPTGVATGDGSVLFAHPDSIDQDVSEQAKRLQKDLLGFVAPETTVGQLLIEIVRTDVDIAQGSLVGVMIGSQSVLYQVIEGMTREEILHVKNTRGFVRAQAKKIGRWNPYRGGFDSVPWLPQPNELVFRVAAEEASVDRGALGHFPGTRYRISVDVDDLVTHNAAILGVLGVGKSFLALELVERMIDAGVKVVCLDLTDQYAEELNGFCDAEADEERAGELSAIGATGKANVQKNVEEGGALGEFREKLSEQIMAFLAPENHEFLRIYNPASLEVWRQDSKPYQAQASMATLTPCEITRIITEVVLESLQEQGMTDQARCCLVYEEAHSLIPEWNAVASEGDRTATNGTAKAILQGRKFGLGCLVITQRTANVTKTILNQCNTVFALRVFDATGMEFLRNYIGDDYSGVLSNLDDRHAVIFGKASSCRDPVLVRLNDREEFLAAFRSVKVTAEEGGE